MVRRRASRTFVAVYHSIPAAEWPYDYGDDPSFRASERGGVLSWGVCRPNIRRTVQAGDMVIFIGAERLSDVSEASYRLTAWGRVGRLVSQTDIWKDEDLLSFRGYGNLLIRPVPGTDDFEYHEDLPPKLDHRRLWLWLLAPRTGVRRPIYEAAVVKDGVRVLKRGLIEVAHVSVEPARNYVLFDPETTRVLARPPAIAVSRSTQEAEAWVPSAPATDLHDVIFGRTKRASLRVPKQQFAHPHIRLRADVDEVAALMDGLATKHSLHAR